MNTFNNIWWIYWLFVPLHGRLSFNQFNMKDIKQFIKDKGQTISSVATAIGITQGSLSLQIKNGTMPIERAEKIASVLGCSLAEMFAENNDINIVCPHCGKTITLQIKNKATE